jgi:hypothetical protein
MFDGATLRALKFSPKKRIERINSRERGDADALPPTPRQREYACGADCLTK